MNKKLNVGIDTSSRDYDYVKGYEFISLDTANPCGQYPGYFICVNTRSIWSIKSGRLKELKFQREYRRMNIPAGYCVSVNGWQRRINKIQIERTISDYINGNALKENTKHVSKPEAPVSRHWPVSSARLITHAEFNKIKEESEKVELVVLPIQSTDNQFGPVFGIKSKPRYQLQEISFNSHQIINNVINGGREALEALIISNAYHLVNVSKIKYMTITILATTSMKVALLLEQPPYTEKEIADLLNNKLR